MWLQLLTATILVAFIAPPPIAANGGWNDPKSDQFHIQTDEGPERYFRYQTESGQYRKEKRLEDGTVIGSYGWIDSNGVLRLRDYIADNAGYRILRTKNVFVGRNRPISQAIKQAKKVPSSGGILTQGNNAATNDYLPPKTTYLPSEPTYTPQQVDISHNSFPSSTISPLTHFPSTTELPPFSATTPSSLGHSLSTPAYVPSSTPPTVIISQKPPTPLYSSTPSPITILHSSTPNYLPPSSTVYLPPATPTVSYLLPNQFSSSTIAPPTHSIPYLPPTPFSSSSIAPPIRTNAIPYLPPNHYPSSTITPPINTNPIPYLPPNHYPSSTIAPPINSNSLDYYESQENPYIHHNGPTYPIDRHGNVFLGYNQIGNGYNPQYPKYDGVSVTNDGFRYYIPRAYHEEQDAGDSKSGSFGYIDPFGIRRVVYYNAGPNGFQHRKNNRYVGFNATPYDPRPYNK